MSSLHPISGEKIYIGGVLSDQAADFVAADFTSQSWTLIDGWVQAGKIGDTANLISTDLINRGRTVKQKGTRNAGQMQNMFAVVTNDPGQLAVIAAEKTTNNYAFRIVGTDAAAVRTATVSVTIAAPGVFTDAAHGMSIGDQVSFSTTGALPTGLTAGTTYFVAAAGFTTGAYSVSATSGGSAITTSGTQSGVHTRSTVPTATERKFVALVMSAEDAGGSANDIAKLNVTLEVNSNIVNVAATGA